MKKPLLFAAAFFIALTNLSAQSLSIDIDGSEPYSFVAFPDMSCGSPIGSVTDELDPEFYTPYEVITITVTTADNYTLYGTSDYDNVGALYNSAGYNPADPLENGIAACDDNGVDFTLNFGFEINLTPGTYYLVVKPYDNTYAPYGSFTLDATSDGGNLVTLSVAPPLPLTLLSFSAERVQNKATLHWATANERNVSHFEIEQSSDGKRFLQIGKTAAAGNDQSINHHYSFSAPLPVQQSAYYRLKMVDLDGTFTYSKVSVLAGPAAQPGRLITNSPFAGSLNVSISAGTDEAATINVYDASGRLVVSQKTSLSRGTNNISVAGADVLSAGVYHLVVETASNQIQHVKAVKL